MASKTIPWIAIVLLLSGLFAACRPPAPALRVGTNLWPGYAPLYLADATGRFGGTDIRVFNFPNAVEVMRAYRNRVIDIAAVTSDEALLLARQDPETRIIMVCDYSQGADMILAQPEIEGLSDLRGRRVGVEPGALGAFMLARALATVGLTPADVTIVASQYQGLDEDYERRRVDAVVTFDPVASTLLARGARRVFDSRSIPGEIADVLVARQSLIESRRPAIVSLLSGWFDALVALQAKPAESEELLRRPARLPAGTFPTAFESIRFCDRAENLELFAGSPSPLDRNLERLNEFLIRQKLLPDFAPGPALTDGSLLAEAAPRP